MNEAVTRGEVRKQEDFEDNRSWQECRDREVAFLKDVEEAAMRGIRSGMDRVCLVAENEEAAKAITGKIEWLASHGSVLRIDALCSGLGSEGWLQHNYYYVKSKKGCAKGRENKKARNEEERSQAR